MTQQRSDHPLDDSKGQAEREEGTEGTMDRVKDAAADAREYAGKIAGEAREAARNFKPYVGSQ